MIELSELQRDALSEIFNIGVGRAGASLSLLVKDQVTMSAPQVSICKPAEAQNALLTAEFRQFSLVSQHFTGAFDAEAMLVFPEANALEIVRLMAGAANLSIEELSEFEQEAMCEVGNIILNACMSAIADMFHITIEGTLPVHRFGDTHSVVVDSRTGSDPDNTAVLLLQVNMFISQRRIHGHIVFLLSVTSLHDLIERIDRYLVKHGIA